MHAIIGTIMATAATAETGVASGIIDTGSAIGNMSAAGILGVVCLACIYALVKVYKDKTADEADLKTIIASSTQAITKNSEVLDALKDQIGNCTKK